jgi:hypothetical protein
MTPNPLRINYPFVTYSGKISADLMFKSLILPQIQERSVQKPYAYFEPITINLLVITILIIDFILTF